MSETKPVYVIELKPGRWLDDCGEAVDAIDRARMFPSRRSAGVACRSALNLWPGASVAHAVDEPETPEPTAELKPYFVVELVPGQQWLGRNGSMVGTPVEWATFPSRSRAQAALVSARIHRDPGVSVSTLWPAARIAEPEAEPDESEAAEQPEPTSPTALELALRQVAVLKAQFSDAVDVTVVQAGTIVALSDERDRFQRQALTDSGTIEMLGAMVARLTRAHR